MARYIPEKFYTGFSKRGDVILGFMTPDGTDKAADKRKETVDNWRDKAIPVMILDNQPIQGFRVISHVVRQGNVSVKILDPRGFEVEISLSNFMSLLKHGNLLEMDYQSPCVWLRDDAHNRLLSITDPLYEQYKAVEPIPAKAQPVLKKSDLQIGDTVRMKDGSIALYGGRQTMVDFTTGNFNPRPYHLYRLQENGQFSNVVRRTSSSLFVEVMNRQEIDYSTFMDGAIHARGYVMGDVGEPTVSVHPRSHHTSNVETYLGHYRIRGSILWDFSKQRVVGIIGGKISTIPNRWFYESSEVAVFTVTYGNQVYCFA